MIDCRAADVEVLPNFYSITFISLNDYLKVFADCVNDKGKPIPLVQKLTVAEIKRRLDTVKCDAFYITDKDDNQLLSLVGYLNAMRNKGINVYTYNGLSYDNLMIAGFLMNVNYYDNTKDLIKYLYNLSKRLFLYKKIRNNYIMIFRLILLNVLSFLMLILILCEYSLLIKLVLELIKIQENEKLLLKVLNKLL